MFAAIGTPEILSAETPTSDTHITPRDDVKRPRSESKHGFLHGAAVLRKARTMFLKNKKRVISGMHDLFSMTCCIMLGNVSVSACTFVYVCVCVRACMCRVRFLMLGCFLE